MALVKSQAQLMFRNFNHFQKVSNLISPEKIKTSQLKKSYVIFNIGRMKMEKKKTFREMTTVKYEIISKCRFLPETNILLSISIRRHM